MLAGLEAALVKTPYETLKVSISVNSSTGLASSSCEGHTQM